MIRPALFALDLEAVGRLCTELGFSARWGRILRRAVLAGRDPVPLLPPALAAALPAQLRWMTAEVRLRALAADGAEKFLLSFDDGETVEAVRLPGTVHGSACLSTQVGCAMACRFCASGLNGVRRNLAAHELLEQIALLRQSGPVSRLVFMGSGEPTQNLAAIVSALGVLKEEGGIGPRHVLLSTVGPAAAIARVTATGLKVTLALSLHALDRGLRAELIPTQARVEPLDLLAAADAHAAATRRPYQVEYVLLGGVNDTAAQAADLAAALRGRRAHVSLIPWNPVAEQAFAPPAPGVGEAFLTILRAAGISAVLRRTVGGAAHAACGQLRIAQSRLQIST